MGCDVGWTLRPDNTKGQGGKEPPSLQSLDTIIIHFVSYTLGKKKEYTAVFCDKQQQHQPILNLREVKGVANHHLGIEALLHTSRQQCSGWC